RWRINWHLSDIDERLMMNLQNCTMTYMPGEVADDAAASVRVSREVLVAVNVRKTNVTEALAAGEMEIKGDPALVVRLFEILDDFDMMFDVVAPSLKGE
ncbi:MAG TPA: alkyl sulfatase C-terminal domain-containing protein, partial [Alphaproteobacteria bacterium]|nr:alkyl sulfatase C-terminal domain-containing protein [Alphaproteobacteria bacterium]